MLDRRLCSGLLLLAFLSCDKSRATAAAAASHPTPASAAASPLPADARRPSDLILRRWSPPADADGYVYADLAAVLKTELFQKILTSVMLLGQGSMGRSATDCVNQWSRAVREAVGAGNQKQQLVIVSYEPTLLKTPISACVELLGGWEAVRLAPGVEAYEQQQRVLAVSGSTLIIGNRALVEASLGESPKRPWPKDLYLTKDRQIVFSGSSKESFQTTGYLSVGESLFAVHADVIFPTESAAKAAADATAPASLKQQLFAQAPFVDPQLGEIILQHWHVVQKQRAVGFEFKTEGTPEAIAQQIGFLAATGIFGYRQYLASAKASEARVTLRAIADRIIAAKPKKLTSLPPVPNKFELVQGSKYQSNPKNWAAWKVIEFSLAEPQYYQYRVEAARDGRSARIIAEGDLDANGKRSQFTLGLTMDPKTHELRAAPEIAEHDALE